jgi:hypothetical protein
MKIVSRQECLEWLKTKFARDFTWESVKAVYPHHVSYLLPRDTGKKTSIARVLTGCVDATEPGLFWITGWSVFPTCQNMSLFDRYRQSLGESRPIHAAPGHVFGESDLWDVECLLDLVLYFYWDATLFECAGSIVVRISHDEWFSVYAKDKAGLQEAESRLERLELKQPR